MSEPTTVDDFLRLIIQGIPVWISPGLRVAYIAKPKDGGPAYFKNVEKNETYDVTEAGMRRIVENNIRQIRIWNEGAEEQ